MRKPLSIKLEDLRQDQLRDLFLVAEQVFAGLGIDFYILGALARDSWYAKENLDSRTTRDVDFALYVSSQDQYDNLFAKLIKEHGFSEIKEVPFRLQTPFGFTIDLIPFGDFSIDDAVFPDEHRDRPVFVNAFEEVFKHATAPVEVEEDTLKFRVATLPAILLLKLIAYDDRPENRTQDPLDIADIILNYVEIEKEMIWEKHHDLFDEGTGLDEIATVVIGREIKDILYDNKVLRNRVLQILSLKERTQRNMAKAMVREGRTLEEVEHWFRRIRQGVE